MAKKQVVIACRGNVLRSPVAGALITFKLDELGLLSEYDIFTRGTQGVAPDDPIPPKFHNLRYYSSTIRGTSMEWLLTQGIDLRTHIATPIDRFCADTASCIFAVDKRTRTSLHLLYPEYAYKTHMLTEIVGDTEGIPDPPYAKGRDQQIEILERLQRIIHEGFPQFLTITEASHLQHLEHRLGRNREGQGIYRSEQL